MNKLKSITGAIIFSVLSFIVGCSEEIISPVSQNISSEKVADAVEKKISTETFHCKVNLKPHQVFTFSSRNTIFSSFNSISVLNCNDAKKRVEISGYVNDVILVLGCNSSGFFAYSIAIENISFCFGRIGCFSNRNIEKGSGPYCYRTQCFLRKHYSKKIKHKKF